MMKPLTLAALAAAASAVSGCNSIATWAGATKASPDEFRVVTKAPLVIPPDYALRPPRPGDPRPQELRPDEEARTAIFGKDLGVEASDGEKALVAHAGANSIDPRIRDQVDLESAALVRKDDSFTDRILNFGRKKKPADNSAPLDAEAEKQRLEREEQVRRASGDGQVTIERDSGGFKLPGL